MLTLLHYPSPAFGATYSPKNLTLTWNPSPTPGVTGYRVYYGSASGNYTTNFSVGNATNNTFTNLVSGATYFFAITAYDPLGNESSFSNEISAAPGLPTVQILPPAAGRAAITVKGVTGHTYQILATQNLTFWSVIGTVVVGTNGSFSFTDTNAANFPLRFYRAMDVQ